MYCVAVLEQGKMSELVSWGALCIWLQMSWFSLHPILWCDIDQ